MNDLFDAIRESIYLYMNVDELTPRKRQRVIDTYSRHVYNINAVTEVTSLDPEAKEEE